MRFLSLTHMAQAYDLHPDTLKRKLKKHELIHGEHYISLDGTIRFDVDKCHTLLIDSPRDDILSRLLV